MKPRPIVWFIISVVSLVGAYYFWQLGEQWAGRKGSSTPVNTNQSTRSSQTRFQPGGPSRSGVVPGATLQPAGQTNLSAAQVAAAKRAERLGYRLSNSTLRVGELVHKERAILLENALIDTEQGTTLPIPAHLRSKGDPGSYIVQSRGAIDDEFRALLKKVGAEIVSYIPNNAYLVRASASAAQELAAGAQSVVPFEPYYKLKADLLKLAVKQEPLPQGSALNILLFANTSQATTEKLEKRGVKVVARDRSPFGPVLKAVAPADSLADIAGLSGVQGIELLQRHVPANDMTRVLMGVARDSSNAVNYLGLTGQGVKVNVTDSGVDATHPDLSPRVTGDTLVDADGHGTHVAGIIASSGANSAGVTNASGSVSNANFRGKAPLAEILSLGINFGVPFIPDSYLQETAAQDPEVFISNNSWGSTGENGYDLTAASYDAAVRDALPGQTGSRPLLFVFSAGNNGVGQNDGQGGQPDTVTTPGSAKNVIAVGATELGRFVTNRFARNGLTNSYFFGLTDDTNQVAAFSSRGNVGIGIEGDFGRFKPDVVAPGTFVVSTRSQQWNQDAYYSPSNTLVSFMFGITLDPGSRFDDFFFVPDNGVRFLVTLTNITSAPPLPTLPIYAKAGGVPAVGPASTDFRGNNQIDVRFPPDQNNTDWYYTVRNSTPDAVSFDVLIQLITTNENNALETIRLMNDNLGTPPLYYRYESGTSMSAGAVSGMLALMQQFLEHRGGRPSPALAKAMVINGARRVGSYDFQVQSTINYQGWGMVNLSNSLPGALTNSAAYPSYTNHPVGPIHVYEQSAEEALVTGHSRTRTISLNSSARFEPLRITLVWTDPPGNPAAGVKLVNDLDLIVTNLVTGQVFYGNDIGPEEVSNTGRQTNESPVLDVINNVENVFLSVPSSNYSITVTGRRVNVNALTAHPDNVAQDYALVIASGDGRTNNLVTVTSPEPPAGPPASLETRLSTLITNAFLDSPGTVGNTLMGEHVGANTPLLGTDTRPVSGFGSNAVMTIGMTNQWHFYVFTNTLVLTNNKPNYPTNYVAFVTFQSQTLALPREGVFEATLDNATREEADIDLYVTQNPSLTNLDRAAIDASTKSQLRGGTEVLVFTNDTAPVDQVFYIGVKSEDRQAAEYSLLAIASDEPFSFEDQNGVTIRGVPVPRIIPDGTPRDPGAALVFGIAVSPERTRRVIVTNSIGHELFGDLLGHLKHNGRSAVLNNHTDGNGTTNQSFIYEDNGEGDIIPPFPAPPPGLGAYQFLTSDGPGSLRNFMGEGIAGLWLLTEVDSALFNRGTVQRTYFRVEKELDYAGTNAVITLTPGKLFIGSVDIPVEATNLVITISDPGSGGFTQPVHLFVRRGLVPVIKINNDIADDVADYRKIINPPGDSLIIDKTTSPPLNGGRYFFAILNPPGNTLAQTIRIQISFGLDANAVQTVRKASTGFEPVFDDAVGSSSIFVTNDARIATVDVGLRIDHPRISDLAITLVSPRGTRVLLMENRGGLTTAGAGTSTINTNVFQAGSQNTNNSPQVSTNIIPVGVNQGTVLIDYNFEIVPDELRVYYDGAPIFNSGYVSGTGRFVVDFGPGLSTDLTIVMNQGNNPATNTFWSYTANIVTSAFTYLNFTENTNLTITPIKFALPPFNGVGTNAMPLWHSTFGPPPPTGVVGSSFAEGWRLDSGDIEVGIQGNAPAYEPPNYMDLNGGQAGTVSVNISNVVVGKTYRLSFVYARNPTSRTMYGVIPRAEILINSNLVMTLIADQTNSFADLDWQRVSLPITATASPLHLSLRSLVGTAAGIYFDAFDLAEVLPAGLYYLPEESLEILKGENAQGEWRLELWDNRAGAPAPVDALQSWQLSFVFEDLFPRLPTFTNTICGLGVISNIVISVPTNATVVTNVLVSSEPVNVFFNPTTDATGNVPPDTQMLFLATNASFYLATNTIPALVPGTDYHVGIQNPGTNCVTFSLQVQFGTSAPPAIAIVTNTGSYCSTNSGVGITNDYYVFTVSSNAVRAQFEINGPSGNMVLVVRKGVPADLNSYDYISDNSFTNDEVIVVFDFSNPVPLTAGNWFFTAVNLSGGPVGYCVKATEWPDLGTDLRIIRWEFVTNSFCVTWNSLIGAHYVVQGKTNLSMPVWDDVSPTITAVSTQTTWCVPLPSPYHFFRVREGLALSTNQPPSITAVPISSGVPYCATNSGVGNTNDYYRFTVSGSSVRAQFEINGPTGDMALVVKKGLPLPDLSSFDYISTNAYTNDELIVVFDYSSPVPLSAGDWYVGAVNVSGAPVSYCIQAIEWPVYGTNIGIFQWAVITNSFCVTWNSLVGAHYVVQGKTNLSMPVWDDISPTITAVATQTTWCVSLPSPYQFFRVRDGIVLSTNVPPAVPSGPSFTSVTVTNGNILLQWSGPISQQYQVQWTTNLPVGWNTVAAPISSLTGQFSFIDDGTQTAPLGPIRFYRLRLFP